MNKTLRWLQHHRVAVLKGGWSRERAISLKSGAAVEAAFKRLGVKTINIDIRKSAEQQIKKAQPDLCFIALHGAFGEDGGIQTLLRDLKIPYTGSGPMSSYVAMDKNISKRLFTNACVETAPWVVLEKGQTLDPITPWLKKTALFVKPVDQGSAIGAAKVETPAQLSKAVAACFKISNRAMVERFIAGRELTVGILGNKALPVVEIIPKHVFYDFHSKYAPGGSRHVVPAKLSPAVTKKTQKIALEAFKALRCAVYGRVDVLLSKDGELYVLEVNTIPGMTSTSLLPDAARAAGMSFDQLVVKICELSLAKKFAL